MPLSDRLERVNHLMPAGYLVECAEATGTVPLVRVLRLLWLQDEIYTLTVTHEPSASELGQLHDRAVEHNRRRQVADSPMFTQEYRQVNTATDDGLSLDALRSAAERLQRQGARPDTIYGPIRPERDEKPGCDCKVCQDDRVAV